MALDGKSIASCLKPEILLMLPVALYSIFPTHMKVDMVNIAI